MKTKEISTIESLIKTENEHWNSFASEMLCETLQHGQFQSPATPLQLFSTAIDIFMNQHENPVKAVQAFTTELEKHQLTPAQRLFVYGWVCNYLYKSEFDFDHVPIRNIAVSQKKKLEAEVEPSKRITKNIRLTLKDMMQKELESLPETLKGLGPTQRLNILCKLLPFVLPKVESVHHEIDED